MVKLSISDDLLSSYSKSKKLVFASLTRQEKLQKEKIENGTYGYGIKFILDYNKELNKFNDIILNGYKLLQDKFKLICNKYNKEPIKTEYVNEDLNQTYTNIVDETFSKIQTNENKPKLKSKKMKKRTLDEADMTQTNIVETNELNQTTKTKKNKKKLKAKKLSKATDKLDTTAELVAKNLLNQSIKSEKLSVLVTNNTNLDEASSTNNPSKKVRLSSEDNPNGTFLKKNSKTKKKRKSSRKKSSALSKKSSMQSLASSNVSTSLIINDCLTSTKFEFNEHKTPLRNNLVKLQSILESNSKTVKAEKRIPSIHASGKVKQMVELCEARMKSSVNNTPTTVVKQTKTSTNNSVLNQNKKLNVQKIESSANKMKLRSSIDDRKKRISNSKNEIKRQSTKRINAFLNDLAGSSTTTTQSTTQSASKSINQSVTNPVSTVKKKLNYQQVDSKIKEEEEQQHVVEQIDEALNIKDNQNLVDKSKKITINNLIASSSSIQQQYRLKHTSSLNSENKNSFNKFLERNTPNKLTKQELMSKEERDQKRLQEREKQLLEKIEQNKKKREEKMKKIDELKLKQQEDAQKRKEELEAKQREVEENKKRLLEEKRREEFEKQRAREQQRVIPTNTISVASNQMPNLLGSAQKAKPFMVRSNNLSNMLTPAKQPFSEQTNKPKIPAPSSAVKIQPINNELPKTPSVKSSFKMTASHLKNTPFANKKKQYENYDIGDLNSGDDTDDDEEPSKPIPEWAKEANLMHKAVNQCHMGINYTKLFSASSQNEIILENIFKIKRKKFTERSSSAIWNSPPVWRTNGINGDESFRQLHNI